MNSFIDLIQEGIMNSNTIGNLTLQSVILALVIAFVGGIVIYVVYKFTYSGVMFINQFAVTLIGLTMITTLIILTITSNLLLSLGMVGALSIVRFRTAIKEPIDMIYMFWAIATGVAIGAGFFMLASLGLIMIGIVLLLLSKLSQQSDLFILVIRDANCQKDALEKVIKSQVKSYLFRAEIVNAGCREWTYEIRTRKNTEPLTAALLEDLKVSDYSLVGYNTNTLM